MTDKKQYDLMIKNVRIVRPNVDLVIYSDIAIKDGKILCIRPDLNAELSVEAAKGT